MNYDDETGFRMHARPSLQSRRRSPRSARESLTPTHGINGHGIEVRIFTKRIGKKFRRGRTTAVVVVFLPNVGDDAIVARKSVRPGRVDLPGVHVGNVAEAREATHRDERVVIRNSR
jgi:hypothetical protein